MGYRSEIYMKVNKSDEDELIAIFKEHDLLGEFNLQDFGDEYARYYGSHLKWYEGYKDVDAVNSFIDSSTEDNPRGLIAIGEDNAIRHFGHPDEISMGEVVQVGW